MNFSVIEQQTMKNGAFAVVQPIPTFNDLHQAMSRYHTALASAHISEACARISVSVMGDNGAIFATETAEFEEE